MRISLAFGSAGTPGRVATASSPSAPIRHGPRANTRRSPQAAAEDVGLEALGQVLSEPGGFVSRAGADGANDPNGGVPSGTGSRAVAPAARSRAMPRARTTIAGGFEAAIVIALLAGGSALAGYPIVRAIADTALVHAMTRPINAHVTETVTAGGARAVVETTILRVERLSRP